MLKDERRGEPKALILAHQQTWNRYVMPMLLNPDAK